MARSGSEPAPSGWRVTSGRWLDRSGQLALPLGAGIFLGYWIADRGVRWMPTMLEALSIFIAGALLAILAGQWLKGKVVRQAEEGERVRKRTVTLLVLCCVAAVVRLLVFWAEQPAPLTRLSPADLVQTFNQDLRQYRLLEREMEQLVLRMERSPLLRPSTSRQALSAADEAMLRDTWSAFYGSAFALDQIRIFWEDWYRFDPSRTQRPFLLRSYLLTFAAELALYEKSFRLVRALVRNPVVATYLDAPHEALGMPEHTFSHFREDFLGVRDEARVIAGEQYLRFLDTTLQARSTASALGIDPLWRDVEQHLRTIRGTGLFDRTEHTIRADLQNLKRGVQRTWYPTQKGIAEWMGDVKTRRIGRYLITRHQLQQADNRLEPGDILLSRKNWYLSNLGLPGFWPHAMLYIGDPDELAGAFSTPEVLNYLRTLTGEEQTLSSYLEQRHPAAWARYQVGIDGDPVEVIEALGEGVLLNSLPGTAGDSLAALRPRLTPLAKAQAIIEAFAHLDKPYDFDFDFATDHALVCTELVWRAYRPAAGKEGLEIPLVEVAGRLTLPANRIAQLYAEEAGSDQQQLDFVYFLDARERQGQAAVASEADFRTSHQRFKWDLLQQ